MRVPRTREGLLERRSWLLTADDAQHDQPAVLNGDKGERRMPAVVRVSDEAVRAAITRTPLRLRPRWAAGPASHTVDCGLDSPRLSTPFG